MIEAGKNMKKTQPPERPLISKTAAPLRSNRRATVFGFVGLLGLSTLLPAADQSTASGSSSAAQANNPLANTTAINFQNYYVGEFTGVDEDANQFILRAAQPFNIYDTEWLARASLPVNTVPDNGGHTTGVGDFNIFAAYLFDTGNPGLSVGIGPQLTAPTASDDRVGSEKWSAGFAHVLFDATSKVVQYGYLLTWQASFAGDSSAPDVNEGAFQPFVFYQLGGGLYLRSTGIMVYDFESDDYTIPLGLGLGKVFPTKEIVYNLYVEPQYSVVDRGDSFAQWQVFAGFNLQF